MYCIIKLNLYKLSVFSAPATLSAGGAGDISQNFVDTTGLSIKRDDPARRKSFRARHNCDNPGPKTKARYWSCYQWRAGAKVDN